MNLSIQLCVVKHTTSLLCDLVENLGHFSQRHSLGGVVKRGHALIFYTSNHVFRIKSSDWSEPLTAGFRTSYNRFAPVCG